MNCPNCNKQVKDDANFCPQCGTKIELVCPQCKNTIDKNDKFCSNCGYTLQDMNNYNNSEFILLKNLCKNLNVNEIVRLAESYYWGYDIYGEEFKETKKNESIAFTLYKKAAEIGSSKAENMLGQIYQEGIGFDELYKDEYKAYSWYKKSAEHGNVDGQYNVAYMYEKGIGVIKNDEQAFYWYKKSAEQENPDALNRLGYLYEKGIGTIKNLTIAKICYDKCNKIIKKYNY